MPLTLTSMFNHNEDIDTKYTCQGADVSPPLAIANVPLSAKSLVLLVDDPDAPDPEHPEVVWDHWVLFNIPPDTTSIPEGESLGITGKNSWGKNKYGGPCPPTGKHRYFFKLYALDTELTLRKSATKAAVEAAMDGHVLEKTELIGLYEKS
ncbi:MAG: YbhB/YbcL family Raf kinase inhibitor-like protein [Candidatus Woesearchaeota archaeon]|nr:YbhB/YbcL family Raf kinase inhibitor-like protein [Candidatus Woesearchaeota archaeon]